MPNKSKPSFVTWFGWTEVAISFGFIFPSWLLVNAIVNGWDPVFQFLILVVGGAAQGFFTGFIQWALLARAGFTAPLLLWLAFVAGGSALAWIVAQVPGFLPPETEPGVRLPLVAVGIGVALAVPMAAQWWVLRSVTTSAWKFASTSYAGWLVGSAVMGGILVVLAGVTDLKITIALLILGALAAVMCASAAAWFGATLLTAKKKK